MKQITTEVDVKKLIIFLFIAVLLAGAVYGQGIRDEPRGRESQRSTESQRGAEQRGADRQRSVAQQRSDPVTVEGTLKLERGFVAIESGETVYLVPMLNRYIGFINDLKEGARVSVEGREFRNTILPTKVTIGGKSYDFPANNRVPAFENRSAERPRGNFAPGGSNFGSRRSFSPGWNNFGPGQDRRNSPNKGSCCR